MACRIALRAAVAALSIVTLGAQVPKFEVASIKLSAADSNSSSGIQTGHGRVNAHNVTLQRCIIGAYGVGPHEISGGPDWLNTERFEILAKAETPVSDDAVLMTMLQDLLAERFHLAFHRESRPMSAFVLELGKGGPKLEKSEGESSTNTNGSNLGISITARNTTMEGFARVLAREMDLPVVNHTGLEGAFNFKVQWARERSATSRDAAPDGPSIFTAIQEQLGLRLRSQKTEVQVIVIDRAEKPTEN